MQATRELLVVTRRFVPWCFPGTLSSIQAVSVRGGWFHQGWSRAARPWAHGSPVFTPVQREPSDVCDRTAERGVRPVCACRAPAPWKCSISPAVLEPLASAFILGRVAIEMSKAKNSTRH